MPDKFTEMLPDRIGVERIKGRRLGTLWYSPLSGEGDVTLSELFDGLDCVSQIDVITDCIGLLEQQREVLMIRGRERCIAARKRNNLPY